MANIVIKGNVGEHITQGVFEQTQFLNFSVAENHGYFDRQSNQWVDKGTVWHDCTVSITNNNERFQHFCNLIVKGTPVLVTGKTSISPSQKEKDGQTINYLNEHIQVEQIGITLDRVQSLTYKAKQQFNGANDPELQQRGQPMPPNAQVQPQDGQQFDPSMPGGDMDPENPF